VPSMMAAAPAAVPVRAARRVIVLCADLAMVEPPVFGCGQSRAGGAISCSARIFVLHILYGINTRSTKKEGTTCHWSASSDCNPTVARDAISLGSVGCRAGWLPFTI